jgi:hypothetical protein
MIPYQKEKIENAICFFAKEHYKHTRHHLHQTFLYKYLALFDFGYFKKYGKQPLGLKYKAMERGPVPPEIYGRRMDGQWSKLFIFQPEESNTFVIIHKDNPNLDFFNRREIKFLNELIEIYAQSYITSKLMSDVSHESILAWRKTWNKEKNALIDFSLEFSGDVFEKPEDELTFPEEVYITQKGLENCI